jgi:hypothetical protein
MICMQWLLDMQDTSDAWVDCMKNLLDVQDEI